MLEGYETMTIRRKIIITATICGLILTTACSNDNNQDSYKETLTTTMTQNDKGEEQTDTGNEPNREPENMDSILTEVQSKTIEEPSDQPASLGEWLNYHGMIIRVDSIRESTGDDYLKPQEGNVLKVLEITVVNTGDKEQVVSSALSFSLSDDRGQTHMPVVTSDIKQSLDGVVAPDQVLRGEIPYEVSKNAKDLKLTFAIPLMEGEAIWSLH